MRLGLLFQTLLARVLNSSFIADVVKLSLGTLGGRIINLLALPLLTRIYSPEAFSLLAVFLAIITTTSIVACLRFEIAIPLADSDQDAAELLALATGALLVFTGLLAIPILFMPEAAARWIGHPNSIHTLWLLPLGTAFAGGYSVFQFWATRFRRFGQISRTRLAQAVVSVTLSLSMGMVGWNPIGLLFGYVVSLGAGSGRLAIKALGHEWDLFRHITLKSLSRVFTKYRAYAILSTPEALLNTASTQLPILLIATFEGAEAGFLLLAMQVLNTPMTLLGGAISQVYVSRAYEAKREGRLSSLTLTIMAQLAAVGFIPLSLIGLLAPNVFPVVFGADWGRSGEIVAWLSPYIFLQFISGPISSIMVILERQRSLLLLTSLGFVLRVGAVSFAIAGGLPTIAAFSISSALFYALSIIVFIQVARTVSLGKAEQKNGV